MSINDDVESVRESLNKKIAELEKRNGWQTEQIKRLKYRIIGETGTERREKENIKALIYRLMTCKNEDYKFACEVCDMNDVCEEKYYNHAIVDVLMILEEEGENEKNSF